MHWEGSCEVAAVPRGDVVSLFARRPARWFHTFLVLAANQAAPTYDRTGDQRRHGTERHWCRLGVPDEEGRARLVWHPVPRDGLFSGFSGHVHLDDHETGNGDGPGTRVTLVGDVTGGEPHVAETALRTLLDLLATAFDGISPTGS
jgi:hypothetical protein